MSHSHEHQDPIPTQGRYVMPHTSESQNPMPLVGIVGIQGKFGQSLAEHFSESGYCVIGSDKGTACATADVVRRADVVIVAVDIYATEEVIRSIAPTMRDNQLLLDITSIKEMPCERMLESRASVIGLHPMWNPSLSWPNQRVVMCAVRPGGWLPWITDFFTRHQVRITHMAPRSHDQYTAVVQGLLHTTTLMQADVLRCMGVDIPDTLAAAGPVYEIRLGMIGRLLAQDSELFSGILMLNDEVLPVMQNMHQSLEGLMRAIKQRDREAFTRYFTQNAEYLGDFKEESKKKTDTLIDLWKKS
ncbi:MAG: prephenate dehydrogenase/arogenate dehydrogenase family protein [bacterium]|nr:prephenate dehydrogenase/arogenate dehydrogenase family protein [bacterium]